MRKRNRPTFEEGEDPDEEEPCYLSPEDQALKIRLREVGVYYLCGTIDSSLVQPIHQDLLLKHLDPDWPDSAAVRLIINSLGGTASDTWHLIDLLGFIRMPVHTVAFGNCVSAGAMILACGDKGQRVVAPNTSIMIHRFSISTEGTQAELVAHRKWQDQEYARDIRFFLQHSKYRTMKALEEKLLHTTDNWMTAEEAIDHGIADSILSPESSSSFLPTVYKGSRGGRGKTRS